jgi:uncharacterized protein YegL
MTKKRIKKVTTVTTEEFIDEPLNEKTQIICVLDRSGSMAENGIIYESINGFNNFLEEQKKLKDKATLTVALFDDRYELLYDDVDIQNVSKITYDTWYPRGTTALYDAIGKTINTVKANRAKLGSEKPAKVLVCIVTDGKNNASHEYTVYSIKNLIKECENEDWNFIYLAANQNAFEVGVSFGISYGNTYNYTADINGVKGMSMTLNNASASYRSMSSTSGDFKTKSKTLIDNPDNKDDKKEPEDNNNSNVISSSNTITNS